MSSSGVNCFRCGKGPSKGVTTFRVGPKGENAKWMCERCMKVLGITPDTDLKRLTDLIAKGDGR
jgi:hypothetical protein